MLETSEVTETTEAKSAGPKRPNTLYLQPFSIELREAMRAEADHLHVPLTTYMQGILETIGLRGRAGAFQKWQHRKTMIAAHKAIQSAKKGLSASRG